MAKQVILAHPFERVSGNVTRAKQKLVYAENDNPAWEAPHSRQYARNFKPQMNLRYSASTGKTSFTIQTKSAVDNTEAGRLRLALFGGSQAIKNAIKKNPTLLAQAYEAYVEVRAYFKSFDSFIAKEVYSGLKNKAASILLGNSTGDGIYIKNPWVAGGTGTTVTIDAEVLQKFAPYLCPQTIVVDGKVVAGAPASSMEFYGTNGFVSSKFNNGDFAAASVSGNVTYKGANLYDLEGTEITGDNSVANSPFTTTAPND